LTALENLQLFYKQVDTLANHLTKENSDFINCKQGCSDCCIDEITVFTIEAKNIKCNEKKFLSNNTPTIKGKCVFLSKNNECGIYKNRPYVCRTQGLPLRWFDELETGELIEYRDICPVNEPEEKLVNLSSEKFYLIGSFETQLQNLQKQYCDEINKKENYFERIKLRDLFKK